MAKRKRLAPAQPRDLDVSPLETKSMGALSPHPAPPIASVAGDASTSAALEELSETLRLARAEGRLIISLPLMQIDETYLVRDRMAVDDADMEALRTSIAARGQQTPIEVVATGRGHYGLISGWRRIQALRGLGHKTVNAIIAAPRDIPDAYVAMIEENEIRVGLSYFERARIVVKSVDSGVFYTYKSALQTLFSTASRAKRSKIKSFILVVEVLGKSLKFPAQLGERLGLQLSKVLTEDASAARRILTALSGSPRDTAEAEQEVLNQCLKGDFSAKKTRKAPLKKQPISGVEMQIDTSAQKVTLKGPSVDAALCDDLELWLKARSAS